jgi:hypothetical protein
MDNKKYEEGKIYRIVCNITGLCYIGSTTYLTLAQRLASHKTDYKRWCKDNNRHKCSSVKVLENNDFQIILIENYSCKSRDELRKRERYWIENMECVNLVIPTHTRQEYLIENKEKIKEYSHERHIKNQEKNLEIAKKYREKYPERIKENNQKQMEMPPILCECGKYYTYKHKARHLKTQYHIDKKV